MIVVVVVVLAACSGRQRAEPQSDDPGCVNASCCGDGWHWRPVLGCTQVAPPYCGCTCERTPPVVYPTKDACVAAHADK
jgi:hypothetical protein